MNFGEMEWHASAQRATNAAYNYNFNACGIFDGLMEDDDVK